jgi:hypothetical protein
VSEVRVRVLVEVVEFKVNVMLKVVLVNDEKEVVELLLVDKDVEEVVDRILVAVVLVGLPIVPHVPVLLDVSVVDTVHVMVCSVPISSRYF